MFLKSSQSHTGNLKHNLVGETLRERATEGGKIWKTLFSASICPGAGASPHIAEQSLSFSIC